MARLIELDDILFPVLEHPVFVSVVGPNGERRLPVPDKKAIVNVTTSRVLGIVSRGYRLVTNREALDMARECCQEAFPQTKPGEWQVSATDAPNTGGHCYMDLVHNSTALDFSLVPAAERPDTFGPFIRVTNSYNALRALAFDIGFYRKVCKNGMILPETVISFKFVHLRRNIGETIRFKIAHERLAKLNADFRGHLTVLRDFGISRGDIDRLVRGVLRLKQPEPLEQGTREAVDWQALLRHVSKLNDRYVGELGENAYAAFNTITEFASQPPSNRCLHRDRHGLQRLAGSWITAFSKECGKSTFSLGEYLDQLHNPKLEAATT
jgi:hypothetical protein